MKVSEPIHIGDPELKNRRKGERYAHCAKD